MILSSKIYKGTIQYTVIIAIILLGMSVVSWGKREGFSKGEWNPTWESLDQHKIPEWFLDAKIGIQYVGPPMDFNDEKWHRFNRVDQRRRLLGKKRIDMDISKVIRKYKDVGAKFLVSMRYGCYPGTEGLWMTKEEVDEARRQGFRVGIHYNFFRRFRIPSLGDQFGYPVWTPGSSEAKWVWVEPGSGDPGYVDWFHKMLKGVIRDVKPDFIFFDPDRASHYDSLKTPELVAWYYNWGGRNGREVFVNDNLGKTKRVHGDVWDIEQGTMDGICDHSWLNWDMLRNEWNCWVNEYGINRVTGKRWVWEYKSIEDLLRVFLDVVSKGGVWCVQMVNTKEAWKRMEAIGDWLEVNGEAIYNTRPFGKQKGRIDRLRVGKVKGWWDWWGKWKKLASKIKSDDPLYFTRRENTVYAIHWGWPEEKVVIPGIKAREGSSIYLLGVDKELSWEQEGDKIIIQTPEERPCKYAYSFRIPL